MHNDNEYDQENELNDRFHGKRFSRYEEGMTKITYTTVRCLIGKCLGFLDISIESLDGNPESGGTLMNCKKTRTLGFPLR